MKRSTFITWDQLKVGAVILIGMGLLTLAILKLGDSAKLFTKRYELIALLAEANGLRVGGTVTVAGQLAGSVKSIEFLEVDNDTLRNLRVVVEIDQALREQVRADSKAKLRTQGLLGDKVFDISTGTPRHEILASGDTLTIEKALDYEEVIGQASSAVGDMVQLTRDLRDITGGIVRGEGTMGQLITNRALYDELTGTLQKSNTLIARLQNPNGTVGRMLDDPKLYQNLTGMISSVDSLVRAISSNEGTAGRLLRDTTLYASITGMAQGADSLVKLITRGNGFASRMLTDQQLYDQMVKAVTDLNAILADVRRDPRRYTKGMIKVGF